MWKLGVRVPHQAQYWFMPTWFSGDNTTFVKWNINIGSSSLPVGSNSKYKVFMENNFIKSNNMESDEGPKQRKNSNPLSILRDFFQSLGIRCSTKMADGYNRQLLVFNFHFLPCISILLYLILYLS